MTVTLKLDDADDGDLLLATPLYCAAQYAAHCYVKVEQGLFVWGTTTKFSRSARVSRLPSSTQLAAVTELEELFGRVDGLRAALGLSERQLRSSDPLLVTSRRAWSLSFPVLVPSGTAVAILTSSFTTTHTHTAAFRPERLHAHQRAYTDRALLQARRRRARWAVRRADGAGGARTSAGACLLAFGGH